MEKRSESVGGIPRAPVRLFFLEVALWDIIGKAVGQPLHRLWGAASTKVQPCATLR
jgi:L-alanine-DL-glutamate epimerase-like enolase superfamily enzyme